MNEEVKPGLLSDEDKKVAALLASIPVRKVLTLIGIFSVGFIAVESFIIWKVISPDGIQRLTTNNGAIVIVGGAVWACIFTLVFVWPMKLLSIEGLRLTYKMQQSMEQTKDWAEKELKPMIADLKTILTQAKELKPFFEDSKKVMADIKEVVSAFKTRDFSKVEKTLEAIEKAIGNNGDLPQALKGLAEFKESFKEGVKEFRAVAKFFTEIQGKIDNPEFKSKVAHAAKTLDALAEYLDLRVS